MLTVRAILRHYQSKERKAFSVDLFDCFVRLLVWAMKTADLSQRERFDVLNNITLGTDLYNFDKGAIFCFALLLPYSQNLNTVSPRIFWLRCSIRPSIRLTTSAVLFSMRSAHWSCKNSARSLKCIAFDCNMNRIFLGPLPPCSFSGLFTKDLSEWLSRRGASTCPSLVRRRTADRLCC